MNARLAVSKCSLIAFAAILLSLVLPTLGVAQTQLQDVVYLKNGSIIRGIIIEQIPDKTIKIKTSDGSVFVYAMSDIEKITKEAAVEAFDARPRKPLGSFAGAFHPLGFLQIGPMFQAEFKVSPSLVLGPHVRFLGLGLVTHALAEYDELDAGSLAVGGGVKYFFGDSDAQDRFYASVGVEYGFGGGKDERAVYNSTLGTYEDASYNFAYIGSFSNFGYRWRFTSPFFLGLGIFAGVAKETVDERYYPSKKDYPLKTYFIGMLELSVGYEK